MRMMQTWSMPNGTLHPPLSVKGAFYKAAKQLHSKGKRASQVWNMQTHDGCRFTAPTTMSCHSIHDEFYLPLAATPLMFSAFLDKHLALSFFENSTEPTTRRSFWLNSQLNSFITSSCVEPRIVISLLQPRTWLGFPLSRTMEWSAT